MSSALVKAQAAYLGEGKVIELVSYIASKRSGVLAGAVAVLVMALTFCPAGMRGLAAGTEWDMDGFVEAAYKNSDSYIKATKEYDGARLSRTFSVPILGTGLSVSGNWSFAAATSSASISLRLPLTSSISASLSYNPYDSKASFKASYSKDLSTAADIPYEGFFSWLVGNAGYSADAEYELKLAKLKLNEAAADAKNEARLLYINALKAIKSRQYAEKELEISQTELDIAKRKFELGLISGSELGSSELALLDAQLTLKKAQQSEKWAMADMGDLAGRDMAGAVLKDLPEFDRQLPDAWTLVDRALMTSPAVAKAEAELAKAGRDLLEAKLTLPTLQAGVQVAIPDAATTVSVGASWDISGAKYQQLVKAEIAVDDKQKAYDKAVRSIKDGITKALENLEIESAYMYKWKAQLTKAEEDYAKALSDYEDGKVLSVGLEAAKLSFAEARDSYMYHWNTLWEIWYSLSKYMI